MSGQVAVGTDARHLVASVRAGSTQPDWLTPKRERAADAVMQMPLPDRRQERWRYTPVRFFDEARYQAAGAEGFDALQLSDIEELLLPDADTIRLVFVNGYLSKPLCKGLEAAEGLSISALGGQLGVVPLPTQAHLDTVAEQRHVFAALNGALMSDGAVIHVQGESSTKPIELLHISVGMDEPVICHPRHLIVLEPGAEAAVVERYASMGDGVYFNNALIEVALGAGSRLSHDRVQEESINAQHLSDLHVRLDEQARYRLSNSTLGGSWSRTDVRLVFAGEGGDAQLDGLMLARDRQLSDVHLDIQHQVPGCSSRETFRGVLDGKGRVVFDGRILVAKDAQKTDAALSNDNLMLSRAAEVDTKPQLEIYADDVKCSHGTTVGELDSDMLFYLRSRGIGAAQARQMLCQGFAAEVIEQIEHPELRARVSRRLIQRLGEAA